jgi:uncharacterized protein YdaU (DUF1376 family)
MHYYQFNIGDYSKSTKHLTLLEDIAYRRMLDLHYDTEKPLPCEIASIARLIVMRENQEEIRQVLSEFWCETEEGWINKRASKDINAYKDKSEKAKKSAKVRWAKQKDSEDNAKGMRSHSDGNANHKPLTTKQEPKTKNQDKRKISIPDNFSLTDSMREWFSKQSFCIDIQKSTNSWIDAMKAKDYKYIDWESAWRNGMRKHDQWQRERGGANNAPSIPKQNGFDTGFEQ